MDNDRTTKVDKMVRDYENDHALPALYAAAARVADELNQQARDALRRQRNEARADLARERAIYADSPDDRLYHAADNTWWRRNDEGRLVRAERPQLADITAERDRLRQELDLALKRNDELRSTQGLMGRALLSVRDTVREVDAELKANAEADRDIAQANERALRRRLNRIAQETSFESALDAEPENGHTVACGAGNEDYSELSCTLTSGHGGEHQDRTQGATWPVEMAVDTKAGA